MPNWAIVIGIDQYWRPEACLKGAVNDAIEFGSWLVKSGEVPERNVYYLLGVAEGRTLPPGPVILRPTHDNIVHVISQLALKSGLAGERFYLHYSGHGLSCQQDGRDEQALVPEDFTDTLTTKSLSLRSILDYFAATEFRNQLFFIDACRNIPWEGKFRIGEWPLPRSRNPGAPVQQFVFLATSPGVKAKEIGAAGDERGAFSAALLQGLKGEAKVWDQTEQQHVVRVEALFQFVKEKVISQRLSVPDPAAQGLIQIPRQAGERDTNPVLQRFPSQSSPQGLLDDAYGALKAEFSRIELLIQSPGEGGPLRGHAEEIQSKFSPHILQLNEKLDEIEIAKDKADLRKAWQVYGEARSRLLPALANDLLAAIGGFYLRDHRLDDAGVAVGRNEGPSFATLAESLVRDDLMGRTGERDYPVLIVGEERPEVSGAVIRLRFPAWDIWNLPLTAHEYGYILSRRTKEVDRLNDFDGFCKEVRRQVNPSLHDLATRPPNADCFLPEVRQFWNDYYNESTDEGRRRFIDRYAHKLVFLQEQQERFVCRLFADAFATLFGGPDFLYALLHLRFWPNGAVPPDMPFFADRFVFALEILKRMNEAPKPHPPERFRATFGDAINKLVNLWAAARNGAGLEGSDEELAERYKVWLDAIYECFGNYRKSVEKTYSFWKESADLEKVLRNPEETSELWPNLRPPVWVVLNAAWRARSDCDQEKLEGVIRNALCLLDKKDTSLIRKSASGRQQHTVLSRG